MGHRLMQDLRREGTVITLLPVDPDLPRLLSPVRQIKYLRTAVNMPLYLVSLLLEIPKHDVVHIFSASYLSFLITPAPAMLVSKLYGKKVILNYHSGEAEDHLGRIGWLSRWLLTLPDRVVVQSEYLVSVFKRFGFTAVAIPNHVDTSKITYRERVRLRPAILVARALEPLYNIPCAIRAYQVVKDRFPDAEMTILGDGSQRKSLEHYVLRLGVSGIIFTGRVEREDIPSYFNRHDIFLNTSSIDNMPVSILEAFSAGLPVVTTRAGGIGWMVRDGENGCLIDLDDHASAAKRIIDLLEHPARAAQLAQIGRKDLQNYTWDNVGPRWCDLYCAIANRAVSHSRSDRSLDSSESARS